MACIGGCPCSLEIHTEIFSGKVSEGQKLSNVSSKYIYISIHLCHRNSDK